MNENKGSGMLDAISRYRGAVMGFAALWILYFHEWVNVFDMSTPIGFTESFLKRIGFCGVDIFFFLSGMGLTYSIKKSKLAGFYYRRIKRILLPFIAVAILRGILEHWSLVDFFRNISGVNFYTRSMYSFLWFVTAILTLYILFPLYYRFFERASDKLFFLLCSLEMWLMLSLLLNGTWREDLYGFTNRIPVFIIGIYMGWLSQQHCKTAASRKGRYCLVIFTLLLGGYLSYLSNYKGLYILVPVSNCCVPNMLMAISLTFLIAKFLDILSRHKKSYHIGKALAVVLAFFGSFSLEFYCIQEWLGGKILPHILDKYPDILVNLVILAAVTLVSFIANRLFNQFWRLIDSTAANVKK